MDLLICLDVFRPDIEWSHENASEMMFDALIEDYNIKIDRRDVNFVKDLIMGEVQHSKDKLSNTNIPFGSENTFWGYIIIDHVMWNHTATRLKRNSFLISLQIREMVLMWTSVYMFLLLYNYGRGLLRLILFLYARFDYIARDVHAIGDHNNFSASRLIESARVINDEICYSIKDANSVYELCHWRFRFESVMFT